MHRTLSFFLAALALVVGGCETTKSRPKAKKTEQKTGGASSETSENSASNAPESPTKAPEAAAEKAVAPTAEDLAEYVDGVEGEGALMAKLETSMGTIHCELFEKKAPLTVANFVGLARGLHPFQDSKTKKIVKRPFYDGLIFHRVIPSFMVQGGDPEGTGRGGPGYRFKTEVSPDLRHDKPGTLSMANAGPDTNGSQFFITEVPTPRLDGGYNVFGHCKEVDVVAKMARVDKADGARGSRPAKDITLDKVTILRGDIGKFKTVLPKQGQ